MQRTIRVVMTFDKGKAVGDAGRNMTRLFLILVVSIGLIGGSRTNAAEKALIQFGSSDPDTQFLTGHIDEMQVTPFDGTVFDVRGENAGGTYLTYNGWGTTSYSQSGMQYAVDDLLSTNFGGFTENFLRINVTPGNVDWFDDFNAIASNAGTAAWIVAQAGGGVRGIMLDTEAYEGQLWQYSSQKYASTRSFSEYQDQVRQRGQEFMQAIQAEAPNTTIIMTHAYSSVWHYLGGNASGLQNSSQALLPAFLDGMVAAAGPGIKLVDGNETTFGARTQQEFSDARQAAVSGVLPIVQDPTRYAETFSHAFPAWMNPGGWPAWRSNPAEFDQNYYTPAEFEKTLVGALNESDQYAWVYGESLYWWNHNGTENIPVAYSNAVAGAKATAFSGTVFSDGSDNSTVGVIPGTGDPLVGAWDFTYSNSESMVLTRTGATINGPSAAFSGSNYLQIGRGTSNEVAQVGMVFSSPVDVTTTSLHVEFQMFFKQAQYNSVSFSFQDAHEYVPWATQSNTLVPILFGDNTGVAATTLWYFDGTNFVATAVALTDNDWNDVTIDWDVTTGKFTVGINGNSWEAPAVWGTATSISRLQFFPSWNTGNMFLDDVLIQGLPVPEPASLVLLGMGVTGLLRRRGVRATFGSTHGVR